MSYRYNNGGPGSSKKRRRSSNSAEDRGHNRYNNSSPPRESTMSSGQNRGRVPPRESQTFAFTSHHPGVGRRRDTGSPPARSPRVRSPIRDRWDRPRDFDRPYNRVDSRDARDNSDRGSIRNSSPPPSAQPGGSSIAGGPFHDQSASKKDLAPDRPPRPRVNTSTETVSISMTEKVDYGEAAKDFGLLLMKLVDGGSDLCALKLQNTAAAKDFEKKDKDYEKSKDHHARFPAIQESQKKSKDRAEEKLKSTTEMVNKKNEELKAMAIQSATQFIPSMIHAVSSSNSSTSRAHIDEVDKKCKSLQQELEDQKRYIDEEKRARVDLEKKYDIQSSQLLKVTEAMERYKASEITIKAIKDDLFAVTKVTSVLPHDLKQTFDNLSSRVDKFNNLSLQLTKVKEDYTKLNKELSESSKSIEGYSTQVTECETKVLALESMISGGTNTSGLAGSVKQLHASNANLLTEVGKLKDSQLQQKVKTLETQAKGVRGQSPSKAAASGSTSNIDSNISSTFLSRLNDLEAKIKDLPDLDERVVTTSMFENLNKEVKNLLAEMQTAQGKQNTGHIEKLEQRVQDVEGKQKSATQYLQYLNNLNNLDLESVKPKLATLETALQVVSKEQTSLQEKVLSLGNEGRKLSNIGGAITNLQNDVALLKGVSIKTKLTSIETRLGVLEKQPRAKTDSSMPIIEAARATLPAATLDISALKEELKQIVDDTQAAADDAMAGMIEQLNTSIRTVGGRCTTLENDLSSMRADISSLNKLPAKVESVQRSVDAHDTSFQEIDASFKEVQTNIEGKITSVSVNKTLEAIRAQPNVLPLETLEARVFQNIDAQLSVKMNNYETSALDINNKMYTDIRGVEAQLGGVENRVEASEFSIANIDKRMSNINTKDMANFIISQLDNVYPHVRNAQDTMAKMDAAMKHNKAHIDNMFFAINELKNRPAPLNDSTINDMKIKLDEIESELAQVRSTAASASVVVATIRKDQIQHQMDTATELAGYHMDMDEVKTSIGEITRARQPAATPAATPAHAPMADVTQRQPSAVNRGPAASPARSMSNGRSRPGTATMSMNQNQNQTPSAQRSTSLQSDASTVKKRKANGSISSTKAVNGSLNGIAKRRKDKHARDEEEEDSDFEPTQPRIDHSDDEK